MKKSLKELSEIMAAAAKGKTIQSRFLRGDSVWVNMDSLQYIDLHTYEYRIRPQAEIVPLDREDLDEIAQRGDSMWIRQKEGCQRQLILRYTSIGVSVWDSNCVKTISIKDLKEKYTWMDGSLIQKQTTE